MPAAAWSRRDLLKGRERTQDDSEYVHFASLLLHIVPGRLPAVEQAVMELAGSELHETAQPGKFVVVLEESSERALADATQRLLDVPGVLTVSIVSHVTELASALQENATDEPQAIPKT